MSTAAEAEKRNEALAGIVVAATVLVVGYASGFGHLLGALVPPLPTAAAEPRPQDSTTTSPADTGGGTSSAGGSSTPAGTSSAVSTLTTSAAGSMAARGKGGYAEATGTGADGCDPGLASAVADPFWAHLKKGHLDESPGQQVEDILDTDQYVKTHTVLVEDMLAPLYAATAHTTDAASTFWMHVKHGHLDETPGQQVADILSTDQYVKTHTVLVEDMLSPVVSIAVGTC